MPANSAEYQRNYMRLYRKREMGKTYKPLKAGGRAMAFSLMQVSRITGVSYNKILKTARSGYVPESIFSCKHAYYTRKQAWLLARFQKMYFEYKGESGYGLMCLRRSATWLHKQW